MSSKLPIAIAYPPDGVESRYLAALESAPPEAEMPCTFHAVPLSELNKAALDGRYDLSTVSSIVYAQLADDYRILGVGAKVSRGRGPLLVSRHYHHPAQLQFRRAGVAGLETTECFLLRRIAPDVLPVDAPASQIAELIQSGQLDAGVVDLAAIDKLPPELHIVVDLGRVWYERTALPLPLNLQLIHRRVPQPRAAALCNLLRTSIALSSDAPDADALKPSAEVRMALGLLFPWAHKLFPAGKAEPPLDVLEAGPVIAGRLIGALAA